MRISGWKFFFPPNQRVEHLAGKRIGFKQKQANFPNTKFLSTWQFCDCALFWGWLSDPWPGLKGFWIGNLPTFGVSSWVTAACITWEPLHGSKDPVITAQRKGRDTDVGEDRRGRQMEICGARVLRRRTRSGRRTLWWGGLHGLNTLQKHIIEVLKGMRRVTLRSISRSITPSFTLKAKSWCPLRLDRSSPKSQGRGIPQPPAYTLPWSHSHGYTRISKALGGGFKDFLFSSLGKWYK